ncbi:hypothetical protein SS50377_26609 [Spironucleus salmonicida]|uniref:Uncharacterized protein n=1 Tax=Spironucleus salmonicida TaxID=348837 RepID=V6LAH7_9EUKA|nr:hypothetical protein SS50377_26609 [Spironucleus salmonicida]|eukprot:EST41460.1 Hypothetical protein SS50377_19179 [Spironucleus salmonicida]
MQSRSSIPETSQVITEIYDDIYTTAKLQINPKLYRSQTKYQYKSDVSALQKNQFDELFNSNITNSSQLKQEEKFFDSQRLQLASFKSKPVNINSQKQKSRTQQVLDLTIIPSSCVFMSRNRRYWVDSSQINQENQAKTQIFRKQSAMIFGDMHKSLNDQDYI